MEVTPAAPKKKLKDMTADERREYDRKQKAAQRERQKEEGTELDRLFSSRTVPTEKRAKEILRSRITNQRVVDVAFENGRIAAEQNSLTANTFYWEHGLQASLAASKTGTGRDHVLVLNHKEVVDGEVILQGDLFALYDYSVSWREQTTFREFLALRYLCKTDAFQLGRLMGMDFHEFPDGPHGAWRDFYPKLNPSGLRPGYSQQQMKDWLEQQSESKERLLMASRSSYKSHWNMTWHITPILCCADVRILFVSETNRLSRDFIKKFRGFFEVEDQRNPTRFQYLFPEHCVPAGDGSALNFESPMRTLKLVQTTAESTSMESTVAGRRADFIAFDDPISNLNTGTEEQCEKQVQTFDAISKLLDRGGFKTTIGTPWRADIDLYAVLIRRAGEDDVTPEPEKLQIRIDPAWQVKPAAKHKPLKALTEDEVILLFPTQLPFRKLRKELLDNEPFFKSQNLCIFPKDGDEATITFTEEQVRSQRRPSTMFDGMPRGLRCLAVDAAQSVSRYADFSALVVADVVPSEFAKAPQPSDWRNPQGPVMDALWVIDIKLERLKTSQLAVKIVEVATRWRVDRIVIEKSNDWESLADFIRRECVLREVGLPTIYWKEPTRSIGVMAKAARIKRWLEPLVANRRIFFSNGISGEVFEEFIKQMVGFDGINKSTKSRKDDGPDALALLASVVLKFVDTGSQYEEEDTQKQQFEAEQQSAALLKMQHDAMFSNPMSPQQQRGFVMPDEQQQEDNNPLYRTLNRYGFTRTA